MPTRELFWEISNHWLIYPFFLLSLIFLVYGLMKRIKLWRLGQPDQRWNALATRIWVTLVELLGHRKILRDKFPGIMHLFIFWGFLVLTIGTAIVALQADFHINTLYGTFYLFLSLALDLAGLVAIIGVLMAVYRRYIVKPDRLDTNTDDGVSLALILIILVTGFIAEGLRIIGTSDPWAVWTPVGNFFAVIFAGMSADNVASAFQFFWWTHFILAMFFIGYLPYSKLFHIISGTLNIAAASDKPAGYLALTDLEDESVESYGVNKIEEFTWKQLMDEDACTRCGRCQDNCPAYLSEKPLSPKKLTQDLKQHLNNIGPALVQKNTPATDGVSQEIAAADAGAEIDGEGILGSTIEEETVWSCTTCRSCMEQCPVKIEHIPKIVDMRRYLVLTESSFAPEVQLAFRNMENNSNPWGVGWAKRAEWADGLDIKTLEEDRDVEYLYWIGCAGSFDDRNKKVSKAVVSILRQAGISFGILGTEEKCCGDSARRLGNEYLYQSLAMENIETLNGYGVRKIITHCPHCFNTLKNDYPQLGGNYEVIHHTELINHLQKQGKLKLKGSQQLKMAYHDSCYLGRYNNIYDAPREILKSIPGISIAEMERNHTKSFCCGAGGGRMWMEEKVGKRINIMRSEQALALQPQAVATNCPFCLAMFEDGLKSFENGETVKVLDLAEIVAEVLEKN